MAKRGNHKPVQKHDSLPRWFRRAANILPGSDGRSTKDYGYTLQAAGIEPFPVTEEKIAAGEQYLASVGSKTAHTRALAWRRALQRLDPGTLERAGISKPLQRPRGNRTLNAPDGTFPTLETDCDTVNNFATREPDNRSDPHRKVVRSYADEQKRLMLVMATRMSKAAAIGKDPSLRVILSISAQTKHFNLLLKEQNAQSILPQIKQKKDRGLKNLGNYLRAIVFYASYMFDKNSPELAFAEAQAQQHGREVEMTEKHAKVLFNLLTRDSLVAIRQKPRDLLTKARAQIEEKRPRWQDAVAMTCNLAASIAIASELLLKTEQLRTLEFDADGRPIHPTYDTTKLGPVPISDKTLGILTERRAIFAKIGRPANQLFPSIGRCGKPVTEQTVCVMLGRAVENTILAELTFTCLRDIGAILLLRAKPGDLRRVAALLGVKEVRSVRRRYRAFLRGPKK